MHKILRFWAVFFGSPKPDSCLTGTKSYAILKTEAIEKHRELSVTDGESGIDREGADKRFLADRLGSLISKREQTALFDLNGGNMKKAAVIMGSDSDLPVVEKAITTLKEYGVPTEVHIFSAHRTPVQARDFAVNARANGFGVLLCAAGKAAHLAGAFAANTSLPVVGIPIKSTTLDGLDALLSTVQMPAGIPVATVAIDGAVNAALLAIEILAVADETLADKLERARAAAAEGVLQKDKAVTEKYL